MKGRSNKSAIDLLFSLQLYPLYEKLTQNILYTNLQNHLLGFKQMLFVYLFESKVTFKMENENALWT